MKINRFIFAFDVSLINLIIFIEVYLKATIYNKKHFEQIILIK
jgi:hypothetical protein